jgi:rfaE bifunctional protein nucleotidyltransferase chain/domain
MIISTEHLAEVRERHSNEKLVMTSGTFDLFHAGHLSYLEQVKSYGDIMVVMLSGDRRIKARKGDKRPIINEGDRARILDGLKIVNYVFFDPSETGLEETDPVHAEILEKLQPDFYVTDGPDPRFYTLMDMSQFIILERMNPEPSTTSIIQRILETNSSE